LNLENFSYKKVNNKIIFHRNQETGYFTELNQSLNHDVLLVIF